MSTSLLNAQISPGKLSKQHSHLEGINNCTQCHTLGEAVSNEKCLNCHSLLNERIKANKGFHASSEIKGKDCFSCHSEHHGLKFEMIRFDKKTFEHSKTGYELKGAHKRQDCASCHKDERIQNSEIRKLERTYLGLSSQCNSCHEDVHQGTLSNNCNNCHDFEHFKPASAFQHNKTKFPLIGSHTSIQCNECHQVEVKNGKTLQKFSGIKFNSCVACHKDVHHSKYGNNCNACHQETSFNKLKSKISFNHNLTGYALEGKHKVLDCRSCHDSRNNPSKQLHEFSNIPTINCIDCHKDPHDGKFGTNCKDCHNQESFRVAKYLDNFNHSLTNFPLTGKHLTIDCRKCHTKNMTDPIPHNECMSCHQDFHQGQFSIQKEKKDCHLCHTTESFKLTLFSLEQHQVSNFPLEGAHQAVACNECHWKENKWLFKPISTQCTQCHQDIHINYMDRKYYQPNECQSCHQNEAWNKISFDHTITEFSLDGKHLEVQCSACHFKVNENEKIEQTFNNLNTKCSGCHENIHGTQFEIEGITDCKRCHTSQDWNPRLFDHNLARFKLEGAHLKLECKSCHLPVIESEKNVTLFRNGKLDCKDCHL
ncbi:MAG: cytochrome c family protein [Saprospiraceae bacterium]|nr:cytochrome c family protein [Saprospiraceae bacterium]